MIANIRSAIFFAVITPISIFYSCFILVLYLIPSLLRHRITIGWCVIALFLLRWICGVRYQVIGRKHIDKHRGPFVILSKHQSAWETFILQLLFYPASTLLKKELLNIPFFGWGLRGLNPIAIDRSNPREALKQVKSKGIESLEQGVNMIMFPEGTRVKPGHRKKYARSGAEIAIEVGVNVIPVAVNSGYCWPARKLTMYPGLITVKIGKHISSDNKTSRELTDEVEKWIEEEMPSLPKPR